MERRFSGYQKLSWRTAGMMLVSCVLASGCDGGSRCLTFDFVTPPSARLKLQDAETGMPICENVVEANRGPVVFHEDLCEFWIPVWFPSGDAGAGVILKVPGYEDMPVDFVVERNECGEIQEPPMQTVSLTPKG